MSSKQALHMLKLNFQGQGDPIQAELEHRRKWGLSLPSCNISLTKAAPFGKLVYRWDTPGVPNVVPMCIMALANTFPGACQVLLETDGDFAQKGF